MADDPLEQAIGLIQAGKVEAARERLEFILKNDRNNVSAWHWYARTWPKAADRVRIWQACLRFNPGNELAQQALKDLNFDPQKQSRPTTVIVKKRSASASTWFLRGCIFILVAGAMFAWGLVRTFIPKNPEPYKHVQPVEYYLYVPRAYSADKEWPLFIGLHSARGDGLECWQLWQRHADEEEFILLCPSIPHTEEGYYQDVGETTVWRAVTEIKKDYRIRQRMFLSGFSAGGYFIQRFACNYPGNVSGLSILSSGMYVNPEQFPELIPMVIVIGSKDHPIAVTESMLFARKLQGYGFDIHHELIPNVGYSITPESIDLTIELFRKTMGK
jgi:predicted esterase